MRNRKHTIRVAGVAAVAVSLLLAPANAAKATPSPNPKAHPHVAADKNVSDPRMVRQGKAQAVADAIDIAVRRYGLDGFTGTKVAPDSVTLYWKGAVPQTIKRITDRAKVRVDIRASRFSQKEFEAAAKNAIEHPPAGVTSEISSAGPTADFTALNVATAKPVTTTATPKVSAGGIPLRFTVEPSATPAISRWDDIPPFWGGDAISRQVPNGVVYCSTAFPVTTVGGTDGMLSAQHCGANQEWRTPNGDRLVGRSNAGNGPTDSMLITGGALYGTRIYVGPWDADQTSNRPIANSANPAEDSFVFASGSSSGASVLRVSAVDQFVNVDGRPVGPGFRTVNDEGEATVGQGDSGGPVASSFGDDVTRVTARGVIDAVFAPYGACVGRQQEGRLCSTRSFHVNITAALAPYGAQVKTQ